MREPVSTATICAKCPLYPLISKTKDNVSAYNFLDFVDHSSLGNFFPLVVTAPFSGIFFFYSSKHCFLLSLFFFSDMKREM